MTIMSRKAAEFWWNLPIKGVEREKFICPPEVSYYDRDERKNKWTPVTWKEVFAKRKEKQESNIRSKTERFEQIKPCFINVYFDDIDYKGSWLMYIRIYKRSIYAKDLLRAKIMDMFPCEVIAFDFATWAEAFERKYHRKYKDPRRKKNALLKCWSLINTRGEIADIYPINKKLNIEKHTV
jgi:hypothetical protein